MKKILRRNKAIELNLGIVTFVFETNNGNNNTRAGEPGKKNKFNKPKYHNYPSTM